MEIVDVPRGLGKTNYLIYKSERTGYPIVVGTESQKNLLFSFARDMSVNIPEPITINELKNDDNYRGRKKPEHVLIDELPNVLSLLLGCNVEIATMTSNSRELYDRNFRK